MWLNFEHDQINVKSEKCSVSFCQLDSPKYNVQIKLGDKKVNYLVLKYILQQMLMYLNKFKLLILIKCL